MPITKKEAKNAKYKLDQVLRLSDLKPIQHVPFAGVSQLNFLSRGGLPENHITLLSGREGSGKTTTALLAVKGFQSKYPKKFTLYIDGEHRINPQRAAALGVNLETVRLNYPKGMEDAHATIKNTLQNQDDVSLIIVDSLAALAPQDELNAEPTDQFIGLGARLCNRMLREISSLQCILSPQGRNCSIILLNQERQSPSIKYGDPTVLPFGRAQLFLSSLWVRFLSPAVEFDAAKMPLHTVVHFVILKSICSPPRMSGEFPLNFAISNGTGPVEDRPFTWLWLRRTGLMTSHGPAGFAFNGGAEKLNKEDWFHKWEQDHGAYEEVKAAAFEKFWAVFDTRGSLQDNTE